MRGNIQEIFKFSMRLLNEIQDTQSCVDKMKLFHSIMKAHVMRGDTIYV